MTGRNLLAAVTALSLCPVLLGQPAEAAVVRRHLTCAQIYLVLTAPPLGTTNASSVEIKNNWTFTIPAGTAYTYAIPGVTNTVVDPDALAPGAVFTVRDARITHSGTCDATVPDTRFGGTKSILNNTVSNGAMFNGG